ncbi:MAG: AbrB/MazE/SpoVT family DNA-binding domain-containing protein [Planctomycetota bacterium]|nr:MAG: AbrB/MazE/SpoVT family DNA-binding domain-containing protein [Planctomycetota bacterium]
MITTNVTTIGESLGIILPQEVLHKLRASSGDQLCLIDTPNGVEIVSLPAEQAEQLRVGRQVIAENQHALRELAK